MPPSGTDLTVFVIAPIGRDARLIQEALVAFSVDAQVVQSVASAIAEMQRADVGSLLIAEEVMSVANILLLKDALADQAAWSDLPVLILTVGGSATTLSRRREQDRLPLGSVTLLERPIRTATLISSVQSALRLRSRQYQVRDTLLERDCADAARRESESRLLNAIATARLGSWELNVNSGRLEVSAKFRENFDFSDDEPLTYEVLLSRVHPEDRDRLRAKLRSAVASGQGYATEYRIVWRDGTVRWMSVSCRFMDRAQGLANVASAENLRLAGVTLDITERVLSEMALRKADKLALVGRLSSSIAHEINNPLEAVTNLLYLLATADLGPVEKEYVATAQRELARVSEIASQTLTFNRQQNAHEEAVIADILDSVLALYQGRLATSGIQVRRRYTYKQPVLCYPGELRQVFSNLIGNAFDATRNGGAILVRERLVLHPRTGQRGTRVTIADTGTGMAPEVKSRLFEAFHSTKGNNGTGLGLWISRGIAAKHGGSLRYRSSTIADHSGSVFCLFIPHGS